jgi:hypothetical protein
MRWDVGGLGLQALWTPVGWLGVDSREVKGWQASPPAQPAGRAFPRERFCRG